MLVTLYNETPEGFSARVRGLGNASARITVDVVSMHAFGSCTIPEYKFECVCTETDEVAQEFVSVGCKLVLRAFESSAVFFELSTSEGVVEIYSDLWHTLKTSAVSSTDLWLSQ